MYVSCCWWTAGVLWSTVSRVCSKQQVAFFCIWYLLYIYIYIYMNNNDNKWIYIIYIFNPWKILICNLRFHEVYNSIHQVVKKMEWNWKSKMQQNTDKNWKCYKMQTKSCLDFVCVSVYGCGCMCVRVYMWMCVVFFIYI